MKNLLYGLILLLLCLIPRQNCYSQGNLKASYSAPLGISPESYKQIEKDGFLPDLFTGQLSYSLSLFNYSDQDFSLPISLFYKCSGFKPNTRTTSVGYGWNLIAGSTIVREINGFPDDQITFSNIIINGQAQSSNIHSFYELHKSRISNDCLSIVSILDSLNNPACVFYHNYFNKYYDMEPDLFYYNINGYSGCFHLWQNDIIKSYSYSNNGNVQIELNMSINELDMIILTVPNGYKYYFGGTRGKEYSHYAGNKKLITGWKLFKILSPNGRSINYHYNIKDMPNPYLYNPIPVSKYNSIIYSDDYYVKSWPPPMPNTIDRHEVIKISSYPIEKIVIDNGPTINFQYSNTYNEIFKIEEYEYKDIFPIPILSGINIYQNNELIDWVKMDYESSSNTEDNNIPFLKKVSLIDGSYLFDYNNLKTCKFPAYGTYFLDHWGYLNSKNSSLSQKDDLNIIDQDNNYNEIIKNDSRSADTLLTKVGLLNKITFPKGGFATLKYEQNNYSKSLQRNSLNNFYPTLSVLNNDSITGGARIKEICTYNTDSSLVDRKLYIYKDSSGRSSGIQTYLPRYGIEYYSKSSDRRFKYTKKASMYNVFRMPHKTHIEYGEVKVIGMNGSYDVFKFSSYSDYPDSLLSSKIYSNLFPNQYINSIPIFSYDIGHNQYKIFSPISLSGNIINIDEDLLLNNSMTPLTSFEILRGKLKSKSLYDSMGFELYRENNYYSKNNISYLFLPIVCAEEINFIKTYNYDVYLDSVITKTFFKNGCLTNKTNFCYNKYGLINQSISRNNIGEKKITRIVYISDIDSFNNISKEIFDFVNKNYCISTPLIQELVYSDKNNFETIIDKKKYSYTIIGSEPRILSNSKIETYNRLRSQYELDIENTSFNKFGYIQEVKNKDNTYTSTLWSYDNMLPIFKIYNNRFSTIMSIISNDSFLCNIQNIHPSDLEIDYLFNKLYKAPQFNNSLIEFLIYNPTTQRVTQTKNHRGLSNYYQYNYRKELICIRDNDLNITNRIEYNFANINQIHEALKIPLKNLSAKLTCTLSGNGTLGNNNSLLRVGDAINLGAIFPVTPSQYYEFDGYYVNGVLIPNPGNYIVQGDVQIEARTKAMISPEVMISYLAAFGSSGQFNFKYKFNGQTWTSPSTISSEEACKTISVGVSNFPIQLSFTASTSFPSLRITHNGVIIYENLWPVAAGFVFEFELTEFGPHEIVVEIP